MTKSSLLNAGQLAERYGYTRQTIYNLVCARKIPFVKIGRSVRFDEEEIAAWERHTAPISIQPH